MDQPAPIRFDDGHSLVIAACRFHAADEHMILFCFCVRAAPRRGQPNATSPALKRFEAQDVPTRSQAFPPKVSHRFGLTFFAWNDVVARFSGNAPDEHYSLCRSSDVGDLDFFKLFKSSDMGGHAQSSQATICVGVNLFTSGGVDAGSAYGNMIKRTQFVQARREEGETIVWRQPDTRRECRTSRLQLSRNHSTACITSTHG